ncbi:histidine utilization repressor [Deferribacter abyssi]|uniref:histidine utilization repressor n=1 Tax=Deferribacter abyssi TaxID=213806 RepID=UPI003C27D8DF
MEISPAYVKIKKFIVNMIHKGEWKPGFKIPSENVLSKLFGVSRMTVNRALRELTSEGVLFRLQGKGTFVAEECNVSEMLEIKNIVDEIERLGKKHKLKTVLMEETLVNSEAMKWMALNDGEIVYRTIFVHFADNEPFQLEDRYVNRKIVPEYLDANFENETAHQYLMRTTPLTEAEHIVEAILPDKTVSELLQIDMATPCLQLRRRTWLGNDVVTYVKFISPGNKYRIGTRFKYTREGAAVREMATIF